MDTIPKIIHYCWFGNNKKPEVVKKCIDSWKKYCPNYEIKEWNESNFDISINQYTEQAYKLKKYAFVTDFARLWIVYNYGGIYLDTDVELIKNIDEILNYDSFFASEDNIHISTGLGFGSKRNSELIKNMMNDYMKLSFIDKSGNIDKTTCPIRNTNTIENYLRTKVNFDSKKIINKTCFFPKEYFCPLDYETKKMNITENTYSIHWFNGSWLTKFEKFKKCIKKYL